MKKHLLLSLALLGICAVTHADSKEWLQVSEAQKFKVYVKKSDLNKGTFDKPFLLRMKSVVEYGENNRSEDSTDLSTYYIDCQNMREALADVVHTDFDSTGVANTPDRKVYFDSRQLPPDNAWKSMGIDKHNPSNFCRKVTGWDDQKVKQGYPNSSWREVPDSPFYFLNTTDLSFATKSKPFPVRAKTFIAIKTDGGEASSVTFTELIDCKNGKSRPISKLFAANDTLFEESHNPTVIHTETVNGEWRPFNEKNKVFSEICKPLNK